MIFFDIKRAAKIRNDSRFDQQFETGPQLYGSYVNPYLLSVPGNRVNSETA